MRIYMWRTILLLVGLAGCGGVSYNTTVADHQTVRWAMVTSVEPGKTTESGFVTRWGNPTQKVREGGETRYIYRNMAVPGDADFPQFGNSADYVIVTFQYGVATGATSSDLEGCRGTFPPRPPGQAFDNPGTVKPVNCPGVQNETTATNDPLLVPPDTYEANPGKL